LSARVTIGVQEYAPEQIPGEIRRYERLLAQAQAASERAADRRMSLGVGASRARVTTANARWATAAEHRDRVAAHLDALRAWMEAHA
jgi:putative hemolysin